MANENINNNIIEQPIKIKDRLEIFEIEDIPSSSLNKCKRGRPITALWRYKEDGTYNKDPINKNYFNEYYRDHWHSEKITCPLCNRGVVKKVLRRHQSTDVCKKSQVSNIV